MQLKRSIGIILLLVTGRGYTQENAAVLLNKSHYNTFAAVPYQKGWVYVTDENRFTWASHTNQDNQPLFRIVSTDSSFNRTQPLEALMGGHVNYGPVVFYNNQKKAVVTHNVFMPSSKKAALGLFFYEEQNGKWIEQQAFDLNNKTYSCGHAAINERGDTLVFASDMPGGSGGTDLYMVVQQNNTWSKPVNLRALNSAGNENFPFLDRKGKLFFASDRPGGSGGLDIYTTQDIYPFTTYTALDTNINSAADDFAYTCDASGEKACFSSNRTGNDQLYSISQWVPRFKDCIAWEETVLCYEFSEEATIDTREMPLVYEWDFGDGQKTKKLSADHCYEKPGIYTVQLNVMDTLIKKLFMNEATYELEITEPVQPQITHNIKNDQVIYHANQGTWAAYPVEKMYWKAGTSELYGNSCTASLKDGKPTPVLLVIRSADGKDQQCFSYGLAIPGEKTNIAAQDSSEKKQPAEEDVYRLVLDESETRTTIDREHFSNLYTQVDEFYFPQDSVYRYTLGEAKRPIELKKEYDKAHKAGFNDAHVIEVPENMEATSGYKISRTALDTLDEKLLDAMLGSTFELPLVYFDHNKTLVKNECMPPLDLLASYLLKNPGFSLEITAHTDNEGKDQFNLDLSQRRAQSVFDYLSQKGITAERMSKKGHGETYPKYPNNTEENKARNRRVEFRILK